MTSKHHFEPMPDARDYCKCGSYKHNSCHYIEEIEDQEPNHPTGCICADCSGADLTANND